MKNKIALFFAMMLTGSVVMTASASAESMYQDIIQFCKNNDEISQPWEYTCSLNDAIKHLADRRESLFNDMIRNHTSRSRADELVEVFYVNAVLNMFGAAFLNAPNKEGFAMAMVCFGVSCISVGSSLYNLFYRNKITISCCKKKIAEIDLAIEKLKAFREKQEQQSIYMQEQQATKYICV